MARCTPKRYTFNKLPNAGSWQLIIMQNFIESFADLISRSIERAQASGFKSPTNSPQQVLISGLGGSGIGGTIVSEWATRCASTPVIVSKDYEIPAWAGPQTLFIASSYSGSTEETLSALMQAKDAGCQIVCICSGGEMAKIANQNGYPLLDLPVGLPPRAAFPYALVQLLWVLIQSETLDHNWRTALELAPDFLRKNLQQIKHEATRVAQHFEGKIPVLYSATGFEGVAVRWRQQINENSKMLCWHHVLPEMNHNELVGWAGGSADYSALFLRSCDDHYRTLKRMELSAEIIRKRGGGICILDALGSHTLLQSLYLILVGDWVSLYLAQKKGIDPTEVHVISGLKDTLSKLD